MVLQKTTLVVILFQFLLHFTSAEIHWPNKRASIRNGDFYLAGFFPIHNIDYKLICGKIDVNI